MVTVQPDGKPPTCKHQDNGELIHIHTNFYVIQTSQSVVSFGLLMLP